MNNPNDRVYVDIITTQSIFRLITSREASEQIANWKNSPDSIITISGIVDHRDANAITHYIDKDEIIGVTVLNIQAL